MPKNPPTGRPESMCQPLAAIAGFVSKGNMTLRKISIPGFFVLATATVTVLSLAMIGYLWISTEYSRYRHDSVSLAQHHNREERGLLRVEVEKALELIRTRRASAERRMKQSIRSRTHEAYEIALHIYRENRGRRPESEIQKMITDALRPIRFNDGRGYFFAGERGGTVRLQADRPEVEGQNMFDLPDIEGRKVVEGLVGIVRDKQEGFFRYRWSKPGTIGKKFDKISYVKHFEPYDWFIGTGEYLADMEREVQHEVLELIRRIRFGGDGYLFVGQWDGRVLCGPASGQNMYQVEDANGVKIVQELIAAARSGGGYVDYVIPPFEGRKSAPKTSFAKALPDWQWYIGAGAYTGDLAAAIEKNAGALRQRIRWHVIRIGLVLAAALGAILLCANLLRRKFRENIQIFGRFFDKAVTESIRFDEHTVHFPEFSRLAGSANQMIQERRQIEQDLKKREAHQRQVLGALPMAFYVARPYGGSGGIWLSDQIFHISGFTAEQFTSHDDLWESRIHPDDRDRVLAEFKRLPESGRLETEYRWQTADGTYVWFLDHAVLLRDGQGRPSEIIGTWRDITTRRKSAEALKQSEATLQSIFSAAPIGIGLIVNRNIRQVNDRLCEMLGYERGELVGQNARLLYCSQQEYERVGREKYAQIFKAGTGTIETRWKRKDGVTIDVRLSSTPLDALDPSAPLTFTALDITAQKMMEEERKSLEVLLQQAQKMEAIGTLAGGIAHDFNNILSPILIQTEMALLDLPPDSPIRLNLEDVLAAANRAKELVKQILTFSRESEEERRPVRVGAIVEDALKLLRASIPTTIRIEQDICAASDTVLADPTQINQILMNLGTNASHAMRETGGLLQVGLEAIELDSEAAAGLDLTQGPYLKLTVSDSGRGMDRDILGRIFDPYFTTKAKGEGTGLGLAVVHGIVKRSGGAITVASEPGSGTCFEVFFPRIERRGATRKKAKSALPGGNERILLVDDEKAIIDAIQQVLERLGYRVVARTSSIEALEVFRSRPDAFDLVVTDQTMPGMTGEGFARKLMALRKDIPIILCTGFSETINEEIAKALGIREFILKPVVLSDMARVIRSVLDEKR